MTQHVPNQLGFKTASASLQSVNKTLNSTAFWNDRHKDSAYNGNAITAFYMCKVSEVNNVAITYGYFCNSSFNIHNETWTHLSQPNFPIRVNYWTLNYFNWANIPTSWITIILHKTTLYKPLHTQNVHTSGNINVFTIGNHNPIDKIVWTT